MDPRIVRRLSCSTVVGALAAAVWIGCGETEPLAPVQPTGDASAVTDSGASLVDANGGNTADTGSEAAAPDHVITYGTCAAFAKCGGALPGTWTVSGGCFSSDVFKTIRESCDGFQESDVSIHAHGTITFTDTAVTRDTSVGVSGKAYIPKSCSPIPANQCAIIAGALKAGLQGYPKFDSATCTDVAADGGGACDCSFVGTVADKSTDTYTSTPDGTVTATNSQQTYDYCVTGNKMSFQDDAKLPFTLEVTK